MVRLTLISILLLWAPCALDARITAPQDSRGAEEERSDAESQRERTRSAGDTILRVDSVFVGDTVVRVDTVFGTDSLVVPVASDDRLPILPGDTIDPIRMGELTVEILRSPMRLDAAPFAVSVLDEELRTTGRSNGSIEEALQGLPGVQVHNRFNDAVGERVSIRGYGARSEFGVRGIKILVDGIPATLPDGQATLDHLDLGSLGRVEALRGPGSALYGNAAGGVLRFESRPPADARFRQEARMVDGDYGYRRRQATTSGQVGTSGYLLNVARYEFGGYRVDPLSAPIGPGADVGPPRYGSAVRDHLNAQLHTSFLGGRARLTVNAMQLDAENPGSLSRSQLALGDRRAFPFNVQQRAGKAAAQGQFGLTWEGAVSDRTLELMAYGIGRDESAVAAADWTDLDRLAGGVRAIVRSEREGEDGRLWWALGFESDLQSDRRITWANLEGSRGEADRDQDERVRSGAVFLQAMLPINPILDVLTGLRYDRIRFSAHDRLGSGIDEEEGNGVRTLDSASPSFGFHAAFHEAMGLYVNLSTAFETPTTTELTTRPDGGHGFNPDLQPQVGITTEVGGRGVVAPALAWEVVFFHTTLHNELVPYEVSDVPGRRYFRNSSRSTREGWEVALQIAPTRYLSARLVAATNKARFKSFEVEGEDLSGRRVPGIAPHKIEGILRVGPGSWFGEARGELLGPIPGNDRNDPDARSPARRLVDLRAGANEVSLLGLRLSPFVGVTNVFDEEYNTSVVVNAAGGRYFEPGPARAVYVGASAAVQF